MIVCDCGGCLPRCLARAHAEGKLEGKAEGLRQAAEAIETAEVRWTARGDPRPSIAVAIRSLIPAAPQPRPLPAGEEVKDE